MPIPTVNDYIPDTAGDLSAGLGIARQIQANRQAAFERQQQQAQFAQQKQQHQQQVIAGLMERGVEPVTGPDGGIDLPASLALKKKKDLARSNGAMTALSDMSPAPEDAQDEDFLAGYVPVKQARDRQEMLNDARIQAVKERNEGALGVQGLRNEGSKTAAQIRADQAAKAAELRAETAKTVAGMKGDLTWGGPSIEEIAGPNGKKATVVHTSPRHVQVLPNPGDATKKLQDKMTFEEFRQAVQAAQFLAPDKQATALKDLHERFYPKGNVAPAAAATAGAPPTVTSKEQFDALPSGAFYINGKTGKRGQKPAE